MLDAHPLATTVAAVAAAGLIILNAHRVSDTSGEGFAVRLYRQGTNLGLPPVAAQTLPPQQQQYFPTQQCDTGNSTGFVRAFSDTPTAFMAGFNRCVLVYARLASACCMPHMKATFCST